MPRRLNIAAWQPDPRDFYEPEIAFRAQRVYRTMTERARVGRGAHFCLHCAGAIRPGEKHDALGVSGLGVAGYTQPGRLHAACRPDFIKASNEKYAEAYGLVISICLICGKYEGCVPGEGTHGLSSTLCGDACLNQWTGKRTDEEVHVER